MNIFRDEVYMKQLVDKINEIIVNEVSFGNELLYGLCPDKEGDQLGYAIRFPIK